jgi:thioredoxin reductase
MESFDVIVVGGSWAGLAAALQLGRARRRVVVVDAAEPRNRFAHTSHGFLGQDGRSPTEILDTFRTQVLAYPTVSFHAGEAVDVVQSGEAADVAGSGEAEFLVTLSSGERLRAERLILATGVIDALPPVPGLEARWGVSVLHCPYCHGYEVRDRRLGVLAWTEMAAHKALLLPDWSSDVTLFTNGAFEPSPEQRSALRERGVRVVAEAVESLEGDAPALAGVRLRNGDLVAVDALFTESRTRVASPLAERLGCAFDEAPAGAFVRTDERQQTTVWGVFCAGDAARAMHTATWAAAGGAMAGVSAHQSLVFASSSMRASSSTRSPEPAAK